MYQLLVELKDFSAAHRLVKNYHGKCNHLHGHNYALSVRVAAHGLDDNDLVVDFSVIRKICNEWVQSTLDHCTLVYQGDTLLLDFLIKHQQKHYVLQQNTTVECLAKEIHEQLSRRIKHESDTQNSPFFLKEIELWESKDCGVVYPHG